MRNSNFQSPLVSIVTPVFNGERFLAETLQSVEMQTMTDYEHVIVDDGSTDGTRQIISEYLARNARSRVIRQDNAGESSAVNSGVKSANGRYITILNSDDLLRPNHLEESARVLDIHNNVSAVYPDWQMIDAQSKPLKSVRTVDFSYRSFLVDLVCAPGPGTMFRADALKNESARDVSLKYISDYEMWTRLSTQGPLMRIPKELAAWRLHASNVTLGIDSAVYGAELESVVERIQNSVVPAVNAVNLGRSWRKSLRARAFYYEAIRCIHEDSSRSRRLMTRSLLNKPWPSVGYQTEHRHSLAVVACLLAPISRLPALCWTRWRYRSK
jgi:glycosyltransferase involved in cell wall biosynthesis